MKLSEKKKSVAYKMSYGPHPGMSKGQMDKFLDHKRQKGRESLNPPHKGRDNESMEGRNEHEKS